MALDQMLIGVRVRYIREEMLHENKNDFAKRCDLTPRHIADIERGQALMLLPTLDKISNATGVDVNYILYGDKTKNKNKIKDTLRNMIDNADSDETKMFYECATSLIKYLNKKEKGIPK